MKYVVVSGGVISGVGKGIIASSAGLLLQSKGLVVSSIKIDSYINIDAGTMSPLEHGEVYVADDGGEMDLDLGNYERYLLTTLGRDHNLTTGKIYQQVIDAERVGHYLGKTVQVVPHVTDAIQAWIERVARVPVDESGAEPDVCTIELGGTVGDIESSPFIYALAQLRKRAGKGNFVQIHVSFVPIVPPGASGEQKTKPTQRSTGDVRRAGLNPDLIACRCAVPLDPATTEKIASMCSVEPEQVFGVHDVSSTYHVPILLERQNFLYAISKYLDIPSSLPRTPTQRIADGSHMWKDWVDLIQSQEAIQDTLSIPIALVGKYVSHKDAYLSISKSLEHAAMYCHKRVEIIWINASDLDPESYIDSPAKYHKAWHDLCSARGVLVPGGFGVRATTGMIKAINWARINNKPFLGVCLGMQLAIIEYSQSIGIEDPGSEELHPLAKNNVIVYMPETDKDKLGGTMRLGKHPCIFQKDTEWSKVRALYGPVSRIEERHRHRYEVNPDMVDRLEEAGLSFVAKDETGKRMEIVELRNHPWFVGVQFHPEYLSRVLRPSKVFLGFFAAATGTRCLEKVTEALEQGCRSLERIDSI